jgi:hypothetical protein
MDVEEVLGAMQYPMRADVIDPASDLLQGGVAIRPVWYCRVV